MYLQQYVSSSWVDIEEYTDSGGGVWRVGVRDTDWVMDCTINGTGFSGAEGVAWQNVEAHKL